MTTNLDGLSAKLGRTVEDALITTSGTSTNYGSPLFGTLDNTGVTVINITVPLSSTYVLALNSTNPEIYFNFDFGTTDNYYAPTPISGDNQIYSVMSFPVTQIVFVGNEGDTWYIV